MPAPADVLLRLLRAALCSEGTAEPLPEAIDWPAVFRLSRSQGVVALALDGIEKFRAHDPASDLHLPRRLKLQWIAAAEQVRSEYVRQRHAAVGVADLWAAEGIRTLVLKGLAFSLEYPEPSHRECGDFDCYLFGDYARGEEAVRRRGIRVNEDWYKHAQFSFRGVLVENHALLVPVRKDRSYRELERLFETWAAEGPNLQYEDSRLLIPSPRFNLSFCLYHTFGHFMSEGIRLRHVCDWYCLLARRQHAIDWEAFYAWCETYRYRRFADALTSVCVLDLGLRIDSPHVVAQSPLHDKVLQSILCDDSAVYSLRKPRWYTRSKLLYNTLRYRWKYTEVYGKSSWRQIADFVTGYLLRTERKLKNKMKK